MKHIKLGFVALVLPTLAACGQPGLIANKTVSPANLVSGTITAMNASRSTMTVAGQNIALSGLSASSAGTLGTQAYYGSKKVKVNGKSASLKALAVGQKVKVFVADGAATEIDVDLELRGQVSSVDPAGSLVVAGKTVLVTSSTRFDLAGQDDSAASGTGSLSDIHVNDFVEVTGTTDATSGEITASKIEIKSQSELTDDGEDNHTEFRGAISGLTGTSFQLGAVTVNCEAPCTLPANLKDGDVVEVDGALAMDGTLAATRVQLKSGKGQGEGNHEGDSSAVLGSSVVLQDEVRKLDTSKSSFSLDGFSVDYSGVTVSGGTLANSSQVKVLGTVDSSDASLVHATEVTVVAGEDHGGDHGGKGGDDNGSDNGGGKGK
jgi:Domain of unknown function (DUF5666)